jgi:hypothetical protein
MSRLCTVLVAAAELVLIASGAAHSLLDWPQMLRRLAALGVDVFQVVFLAPGAQLTAAALVENR